jgi:hypothetical protein
VRRASLTSSMSTAARARRGQSRDPASAARSFEWPRAPLMLTWIVINLSPSVASVWTSQCLGAGKSLIPCVPQEGVFLVAGGSHFLSHLLFLQEQMKSCWS